LRAARELRTVPGKRPFLRLDLPIWVARQVFSFEMAFVLFLLAPLLKSDPRLAWLPIDMTVAFFGLSVLAGFVVVLRGGITYAHVPGIKAVWAGAMLAIWLAAGQLWSPSQVYAQEKVTLFATINLWCLIATAVIIGSSRVRVWRFVGLLLVLGSVLSLDYLLGFTVGPGIMYVENYLLRGRVAGLAVLVAFVLWLRSPALSVRGLILLATVAACGYTLLAAGGRAPTTAVAVSMLVPPLLSLRLPHGRLVIDRNILLSLALIAGLALVVVYLATMTEDLRTLRRFDVLLTAEGGGASAAERLRRWQHAFSNWLDRPFVGHGTGSWPVLYRNLDHHTHPHNLIFELLVEFGLIGLALFGLLVYVLVRRVSLHRLRQDAALLCAVLLSLNAFINAMSTGDLTDNRNLFAMLGLLAVPKRTS
jgi:O-antigen ligase